MTRCLSIADGRVAVRAARMAMVGLLVLGVTLAVPFAPAQAQPVTAPAPQAISIPSYFHPGTQAELWTQVNSAHPTVRQVIINPSDGPGSSPDPDYAKQVKDSQAAGLRVLGYVATAYGDLSLEVTVRKEVDRYYLWYGVDGIFFDEASNDCAGFTYYRGLYEHVKGKGGKAIVVLNPGTHTDACYMDAADIVVNFEGTHTEYASYVALNWVHNYSATRFWHLIYDTPESQLLTVIDRSRTQNAGWLYSTPDGGDNPWDSLPSGSYWATELEELAPLTRWRAINDATTVAYRTHYNGSWDWLRAYLDTDRDATSGFGVGGVGADYLIENGTLYRHRGGGWDWAQLQTLPPATTPNSVEWTVDRAAIGETGAAETASVVYQAERHQEATWTAPAYLHDYSDSSGSISRYGADNDARNVYYEATITAPHAFKHVFIDTDQDMATGYRIPTGGIGADYLIENGSLYRHSGGGWSWTALGSANLTVSGSLYRWSVARGQLGETGAAGEASTLVFHGSDGTPAEYYTPAYIHRFTGSTATSTTPAPATLLAAGDIATCGSSMASMGDEATGALLDQNSGTVATLGDNVYPNGTATEFTECYDPSWGRHKARTRPAAGNHDYATPGAAGYYGYFGPAAGDPSKGYYSYQLGSWQIIVLNSNCGAVGGCGEGSPQEQWLRAELRDHPSDCTLAYWHHPRFSSGTTHGSETSMQPFWQALYDYGADVVLNGHEHNYERFAPQTPSGNADPARGIRQFVVGTGGRANYPIDSDSLIANSEAHNDDTLGVLKLTLGEAGYDWQFLHAGGEAFTDTGSGACH